MGVNPEATTSLQDAGKSLERMLPLFGGIARVNWDHEKGAAQDRLQGEQVKNARVEALLVEQEGLAEASGRLRQTRKATEADRKNREQARAASKAEWGVSGLAMSGSKALVDNARSAQDRQLDMQAENAEDAVFRNTLNNAVRRADQVRARSGIAPGGTLITLGSKVYSEGNQS